jgi:hypothetical protein
MLRYCFNCKKLVSVSKQKHKHSSIFDMIKEYCEVCHLYLCQYVVRKDNK